MGRQCSNESVAIDFRLTHTHMNTQNKVHAVFVTDMLLLFLTISVRGWGALMCSLSCFKIHRKELFISQEKQQTEVIIMTRKHTFRGLLHF